jgi:hypothetical protein
MSGLLEFSPPNRGGADLKSCATARNPRYPAHPPPHQRAESGDDDQRDPCSHKGDLAFSRPVSAGFNRLAPLNAEVAGHAHCSPASNPDHVAAIPSRRVATVWVAGMLHPIANRRSGFVHSGALGRERYGVTVCTLLRHAIKRRRERSAGYPAG